ncbi:hypothetical protein QBC41DRAFT_355183 [Cercophora samala]|uniref:Uncharacterized protein n=1 Tax=Cercophora samala TaxID=330535 RepID=A0AA40DCK1_9PEZI|nr:hypothetical protein QBC41DRAFT_355183 [Cercophora samala]
MPPQVAPSYPEPESESESDDVSDSESEYSDQSIDNDPLKTEDMSDSAHGTVSHVLGRLPDNPKRKAEHDSDGDNPSRSKRPLTSVRSVSSSSTPDVDTPLTIANTNGSLHARQSFVAPSIEQSTTYPCFELLEKTFPQYRPIEMRTFPFFLWLCRQPVRRIPPVSIRCLATPPGLRAVRRDEGALRPMCRHQRSPSRRRPHSRILCQLLVWKAGVDVYPTHRSFQQ